MREHLYKGLREDGKGWIQGYYCSNGMGEHFIIHRQGQNLMQTTLIIPETVCQFTGQYYRDETRVFEGDIADQYNHDSDDSTRGVVAWSSLESGWEIDGAEGTVRLYKYHKKTKSGSIHDKTT